MMTDKIIVMSDIHIVAPGETIIGLDPSARFAAGLAHALATHPDASRIVLIGDLTHHGAPEEYQALRALLADVPIPVHMTLGNHDRREAFRQVFPDAPDVAGFVCENIPLNGATLVLGDTLDGPPYPAGHHAGAMCAARLAWLDAALGAAERPILALHHHPAPILFPGMDRIALTNGDAVLDIAAKAGTQQMIFGHVHRTISGQMRGIPFAIFKSPCHQMPMDMHSTSSALSVDEPGAYGILCVTPDSLILHTEDFTLGTAPAVDDPHSR